MKLVEKDTKEEVPQGCVFGSMLYDMQFIMKFYLCSNAPFNTHPNNYCNEHRIKIFLF